MADEDGEVEGTRSRPIRRWAIPGWGFSLLIAVVSGTTPLPADAGGSASHTLTGRVLVETVDAAVVPATEGVVALHPSGRPDEAITVELGPDGHFTISSAALAEYWVLHVASTDGRASPVREFHLPDMDPDGAPVLRLLPDGVARDLGDIVLEARAIDIDRIAGDDRFATAAAVATDGLHNDESVGYVVVNGLGFADAIAAGPLATRLGARILLTRRDDLPPVVREALAEHPPLSVTTVGGEGVISSLVEAELNTLTRPYQRISGTDRYATSRAVVQAMLALGGVERLFVVTGRDYPDALTAAAAAARHGGAVLLVDGTSDHLDAATVATILEVEAPITVVGGHGVVSGGIEAQLGGLGVAVERIGGADRYETAVLLADKFFPFLIASDAYLANGLGFADALAAAPIAGARSAPVLLARADCLPTTVASRIREGFTARVRLVGGSGALSSNVAALMSCS